VNKSRILINFFEQVVAVDLHMALAHLASAADMAVAQVICFFVLLLFF
jgi:hypothetical protein